MSSRKKCTIHDSDCIKLDTVTSSADTSLGESILSLQNGTAQLPLIRKQLDARMCNNK